MNKLRWASFMAFVSLVGCSDSAGDDAPNDGGAPIDDTSDGAMVETSPLDETGSDAGETSETSTLTDAITDAIDDAGPVAEVTTHPRLWLRDADVARLRGWAVDGNPLWKTGLAVVGERSKTEMDAGGDPFNTPECGSYGLEPCEGYAELFAFLSLIDSDAGRRADYQTRAHTLLMKVIDLAAAGKLTANFATDDRSRWHGEAFALTVDWIYPALTKDDKAKIRTVFLHWANDDEHATTTSLNHPEPIGVLNDPVLLKDRLAVRFAGNNYYAAHMRNLGLMAMALDPADDDGGKLRGYLKEATGAWLYVFDDLTRTDCAGGLCAEGFEYSPQTISYAAEFMWALRTAGDNDVTRFGKQVRREGNPFYDDALRALLHALSPATTVPETDIGAAYQPAWYGDGQNYYARDFVDMVASLGLDAQIAGDSWAIGASRWIEKNATPGGAAAITERVARPGNLRDSLLYFMLFDPTDASSTDPHTAMPTDFFAPGVGFLFARSDWSANASWFSFHLGWEQVDHQHADGNDFGFYRKGEWLTKEVTGYGSTNTDIEASDAHDTMSILNNGPTDHADYRLELQRRGSQFPNVNDGDGKVLAYGVGGTYAYALGDATKLYDSAYESHDAVKIDDVTHASRSIVWVKPDFVVVYDRAETKTDGRFKRFWLHFSGDPSIDATSKVITVKTPKGQQLFVTALLPSGATIARDAPTMVDAAHFEPMKFRTKTETTAASARFLHVLQGADAGAPPATTTLVRSTSGPTFEGAMAAGTLVLFPKTLGALGAAMTYAQPTGTTATIVTGLEAGKSYDVTTSGGNITIAPGTKIKASDAGVIVF